MVSSGHAVVVDFFKKFYKIKTIIIITKYDPVKIEMGVLWRETQYIDI